MAKIVILYSTVYKIDIFSGFVQCNVQNYLFLSLAILRIIPTLAIVTSKDEPP